MRNDGDVVLYRDSSSPKPELTGSAEIPQTAGLVRLMTATGVKAHRGYVMQGGEAKFCT